jgi:heme oxygenase
MTGPILRHIIRQYWPDSGGQTAHIHSLAQQEMLAKALAEYIDEADTPWKIAADERDQRVKAVEAVLAECGMSSVDDMNFEEDFAEAVRENGAWRLARDLRKALGKDEA